MAFFSRPEEPHSQGGGRPEPISRDRLEAVLGRTPSYHAAQAYAGIITAVDVLSRAASFDPADVQAALDWIRTIDGIVHAAVIVDETFGTWGELEIVPLAANTNAPPDSCGDGDPAKEG